MKNPHAVALGRKGGKAGTGPAKARTSAQARRAVMARWAKAKAKKPKRGMSNAPLYRHGYWVNGYFAEQGNKRRKK